MKPIFSLALMASAAAVSGCSSSDDAPAPLINTRPSFIVGTIAATTYDGTTNDLLTGGLGRTGLQAAAAPAFVDANNPTAAELRIRAIYNNYRALLDATPNGGFGSLYGPNVDAAGVAGTGEGRVAGDEHIAFSDDGTGRVNVTMMLQIPSTFNPAAPCIITATSSGSRGIYGAIGTSGEWGLKNGCAVAYTDKGTGNGAHDLMGNMVTRINGTLAPATAVAAGSTSSFTANLTDTQRAAFNAATPNRWAFKHAHSQQNPERDWGTYTLQAVQFAFFVLNERFGTLQANGSRVQTIVPGNTIVIASSVSNGAGAALAAAEADTTGLIDGIAVAEPQVQVAPNAALTIRRGGATVPSNALSLLDFNTLANLYQPCASQAASLAAAPGVAFINVARAQARCTALRANGLLTTNTLAEQADESLARLRTGGVEADSDLLQASHYAFAVPAISITYAKTYARASVADNLCGFSFGATSAGGTSTALATASAVGIFASGNGIPPTGGINVINNNSVGGPVLDGNSFSPSTNMQDLNFDGANCLRSLVTGGSTAAQAAQASIAQVRRTGNLRGKPAIIVHGRADALVPVNHSSRPYVGNNRIVEGAASRLNYYEVTNAQHFDAFIGNALLAGYDTRYVPLHRYLIQALDLMYANLRTGAALPPSQVVRTVPRGGTPGAAPAITLANVPPIVAAPTAGNAITFSANVLTIPE
ncbi:MAG: 3-hydroxybutyrate oligomer hydrolase family protein [Burkholderiaceae bacterium]